MRIESPTVAQDGTNTTVVEWIKGVAGLPLSAAGRIRRGAVRGSLADTVKSGPALLAQTNDLVLNGLEGRRDLLLGLREVVLTFELSVVEVGRCLVVRNPLEDLLGLSGMVPSRSLTR
jgi:hypothetical protein